jgi:uncharacterized membrane protein
MNTHLLLAIFHVVVVAPFFLYVGFQRAATPEWLYNFIFGLGLILGVYHGAKGILRLYAKSSSAWINLFHAALIAPLLIWIGYYGKKTERPAYELLIMAGFAALGYHLKSILLMTNTILKDDD